MPLIFLLLMMPGTAKSQDCRRYSISITFKGGGNSITGICIMRIGNKHSAMSVINEFGIKGFDATCSVDDGKVRLHNVIAPLDKWIVRRVIAKDMSYILNPGKMTSRGRTITLGDDGRITLSNKRFEIIYDLIPIKGYDAAR